jgi:hypothetical protein
VYRSGSNSFTQDDTMIRPTVKAAAVLLLPFTACAASVMDTRGIEPAHA